jgi:hypothetical protein
MIWEWFVFGISLFSIGFFAGCLTVMISRDHQAKQRLRVKS